MTNAQNNLKALQQRLEITQEALAARLGLSRRMTISEYLNGRSPIPRPMARLIELELEMLDKRTTPLFKHNGQDWVLIDQGDKQHVTLKAIAPGDSSGWLYDYNQLRLMPYYRELKRWLTRGLPFPEGRNYNDKEEIC